MDGQLAEPKQLLIFPILTNDHNNWLPIHMVMRYSEQSSLLVECDWIDQSRSRFLLTKNKRKTGKFPSSYHRLINCNKL